MKNSICIRLQADAKQICKCRDRVQELNSKFKSLSGTLNLTGNEVRLKILYLLYKEKELCVCDLSDILGMNVSAISQHLRKLKDRNIITSNKEAQTIFYSLLPEQLVVLQHLFNILELTNDKSVV